LFGFGADLFGRTSRCHQGSTAVLAIGTRRTRSHQRYFLPRSLGDFSPAIGLTFELVDRHAFFDVPEL
jgi:hypothetical protein